MRPVLAQRRLRVRPGVWVGVASVAALALVWAPPAERPGTNDIVQAVPRGAVPGAAGTASGPGPAARNASAEVLRVVTRQATEPAEDGRLWLAQPAPVQATPAPPARQQAVAGETLTPPAPTAPPPPFRVIGRYADDRREGVVLQGADGSVSIAHAGETLADSYRVDSLAGNVMVLSYLPLNLKLTMDIGIAR